MRFVASILFLGAIAWSCSKGAMATPKDESGGEAIVFNINSSAMLEAVNAAREKGCNCGSTWMPPVPPLTWNNQLAQAASKHSLDMNSKRYFSHDSRDGTTPGQRIKAAGYNWRAYGENIAYNNTDEKGVVQGWLKSEGHCKSIMSPLFKEMGAGRAGAYWTQDFGARQ